MIYRLIVRTRTRPNVALLALNVSLERAVRMIETLEDNPEFTFELVERS